MQLTLEFHLNNLDTQMQTILDALKRGERLTHNDAQKRYSVSRLAAVVHKLRRGHEIKTDAITVYNQFGKPCHVAQYRYVKPLSAVGMTQSDLDALPDVTPQIGYKETDVDGKKVRVPVALGDQRALWQEPDDGTVISADGRRWMIGRLNGVRVKRQMV